jgi:uncharacterized membrane protein YgaE (UPF0421/DUF939 family)
VRLPHEYQLIDTLPNISDKMKTILRIVQVLKKDTCYEDAKPIEFFSQNLKDLNKSLSDRNLNLNYFSKQNFLLIITIITLARYIKK